jgi:localization factor PodJL
MRPDLPWNVAGIPPEAREAARAAARREGLSVGEWMTRRIIRDLAGESESLQPMRESYSPPPSFSAPPSYRQPVEEAQPSPRRDAAADMFDRVSRSENETQDVYRRLETTLGGLGRRLEATERSSAENNRAMSKAATEINIAAREQAQAFDQLSGHVVNLSDRLSRIESAGGNDGGMKDAVKTLHQGLARLADQITQTAKQSATQIETLANNLESVAAKVAEVRSSADGVGRTMEQRMAMLDERVRVVERVSHASADALDKALENMEARQMQRSEEAADIHRRVGGVEHLNDALDRLTSRFASSEAQTATAIARVEDQLLRLDSRGSDPAIDRRLNSIERTLGDIVAKFEGASSTDETLRRLANRLDSIEQKHEEAEAERAAAPKGGLHDFNNNGPTPQPSVYAPQSPAFAPAVQAGPTFDAPPFPEPQVTTQAPAHADPFADAFAPVFGPANAAAPGDMAPPTTAFGEFVTQPQFAGATAFDAPGFAPAAAPPPPVTNESFLAAARRSAQAAAAAADSERSKGFGGFGWRSKETAAPEASPAMTMAAAPAMTMASPAMAPAMTTEIPAAPHVDAPEAPAKSNRTRYLLIGAGALVAILAVTSIILSQHAGVTQAEQHNGIGALFNDKKQATANNAAPNANANSKVTPVPYTPQDQMGGTDVAPNGSAATPPAANDSFSAVPAPKTAPNGAAPVAPAQPPKTASTALDKLTALANSGNAKAELLIGLKYIDGDGIPANPAEGAKWLQKSAAQNEPVAAYRLGTLYERGKGVPADAAKATHFYQVAAQAGNRKAMHNLAVAYAQGSGTTKNFAEAARWFSKAAALGLSDSQFNLAVLYERGLGVPQSLTDAYKWYAIAASQGDTESKARIDALATQLSAEDKAAAQRSAEMFKPQALDRRGNATPDIADVTR